MFFSRQNRANCICSNLQRGQTRSKYSRSAFELNDLLVDVLPLRIRDAITATTVKMYEDCVLQSMRFPQKLWRIVNECKSGAIQWGPNGDTILLDYKRFQTEYLDTRRPIFKTTNITSFIRQLNLYGFRKVTYAHTRDPIYGLYNPHVHEFLHDNFRVDRSDLLSKVCRKASASKGKCFQHDSIKNTEDSLKSETNCVSRLKMCQVLL